MRAFITGAEQVAHGLIDEVTSTDEAVVLRRSDEPIPAARVISGDAAHRPSLRASAAHSDAIFHFVHASYDPRAWRRELPEREQAVMDVAHELGIPVVFPESVYAFGRSDERLV